MSETLKDKCIQRDHIEFLANVLKFNRELMELNIKYDEEIKELKNQLQQKENIIKDIKAQLGYLETYSSKEDVFEDMSRRLDRIEKIIKGDSSNE